MFFTYFIVLPFFTFIFGACTENRTLVLDLEGLCTTIVLHTHLAEVAGFEPAAIKLTAWSLATRVHLNNLNLLHEAHSES